MTVTGIGGIFFRANDPDGLQAWYRQHLGIGAFDWVQQAGPTVFMPFALDTGYFPADRQWMMNFRVDDLDAIVASLASAGVAITTNPDWDTPETGKFARIHDPEGNPIELWEPPSG